MNLAVPGFASTAPWTIEPVRPGDLTRSDVTVLTTLAVGGYGDGLHLVYSRTGRRTPTIKQLRALDSLGLVDFHDAASGGWERGMWGARLTCVGANAAYRAAATSDGDTHLGCGGTWTPDATCTGCRTKRPLDLAARRDWLAHLTDTERDRQLSGPQLYCLEHGWMRRDDVTTTKVCRLAGTTFHDQSLYRV